MRNTWLLSALLALPCLSFAYSEAIETGASEKPTVINSDELEMSSDATYTIFHFIGNVHVEGDDLDIHCDALDAFAQKDPDSASGMGAIERILAMGDVDITQGVRKAHSDEAEVFMAEGKLVLTGNPRVQDEQGEVHGYKITFFQGQRKALVEGAPGERPTMTLPGFEGFAFSLDTDEDDVVADVDEDEPEEILELQAQDEAQIA